MAKFSHLQKTVPLPQDFITEYMPKANPTYVMVYLYGLGLCHAGDADVDNTRIAEALDVLESDVLKAWRYWKKVGAIEMDTNMNIIFASGALRRVSAAKDGSASPKPAKKARENAEINEIIKTDKDMAQTIKFAENILKKPLSQREIRAIYAFAYDYALPYQVILMLLEYCAGEEKTNIAYIEKVAQGWADEGVNDVKAAEKLLKRRQKEEVMLSKCKRIFGLERAFSDAERAHVTAWAGELGMSEAMIKRAYEITVQNTGKIAFAYMNKILRAWSAGGIKTVAQIPAKKSKDSFSNAAVSEFDEIRKRDIERMAAKARRDE